MSVTKSKRQDRVENRQSRSDDALFAQLRDRRPHVDGGRQHRQVGHSGRDGDDNPGDETDPHPRSHETGLEQEEQKSEVENKKRNRDKLRNHGVNGQPSGQLGTNRANAVDDGDDCRGEHQDVPDARANQDPQVERAVVAGRIVELENKHDEPDVDCRAE